MCKAPTYIHTLPVLANEAQRSVLQKSQENLD